LPTCEGVDTDARDLRRCRMGLLTVAILHWIAFALMVSAGHSAATGDHAPQGVSLAAIR
jgi:hypothetical protein